MKRFNLNLAKEGHQVETKDGRKVRILCFDANREDYPIVALIKNANGVEDPYSYTEWGEHVKDEECDIDLVMAEEPQPGKVFIEQILIEDGESTVITKAFSTIKLARLQSYVDIDKFGMMYDGNVIERSPDKYIMKSDTMKVTIIVVERETMNEINVLDDEHIPETVNVLGETLPKAAAETVLENLIVEYENMVDKVASGVLDIDVPSAHCLAISKLLDAGVGKGKVDSNTEFIIRILSNGGNEKDARMAIRLSR